MVSWAPMHGPPWSWQPALRRTSKRRAAWPWTVAARGEGLHKAVLAVPKSGSQDVALGDRNPA